MKIHCWWKPEGGAVANKRGLLKNCLKPTIFSLLRKQEYMIIILFLDSIRSLLSNVLAGTGITGQEV